MLDGHFLYLLIPQTQLQEQECPTEGVDIDLEILSTKELAYHITLFEWDLFWAVHEYELLYHTFGRHHFGKVGRQTLPKSLRSLVWVIILPGSDRKMQPFVICLQIELAQSFTSRTY